MSSPRADDDDSAAEADEAAEQPVPRHAPPVYDSLPALPIMELHEDFQPYSPVPPEGWITEASPSDSSSTNSVVAATAGAATEAVLSAAAPVASALSAAVPDSVKSAAGSAAEAAKSAASAASEAAQAAAASASAAAKDAGVTDAVSSAAGSVKSVAATAADAAKGAASTAAELIESTGAIDAAKGAASTAADSLKSLAADPNVSLQSAAASASSAAATASGTAKNAAAAGLSALPISAIAGIAAAASSSAPLLSPVSPIPISLFTQLRTAQNSEGGTAAAAAILLAKANELMELAGPEVEVEETEAEEEERIRREEEALDSAVAKRSQQAGAAAARAPTSLSAEAAKAVPLDSDTRSRLACQAEELRGYSELLVASEGGAGAAAVWSVLEDKYNQSGSGLRNEALNLWTQLHASVEAKELTVEALDLLAQWQSYAATPEGQALLLQSGSKLRQQSAILGALLTADGTAVIKKEQLMAKTSKVGSALKDDADVATLLNQGSALLSSWSQDELHGKPPAGDDKHDSPSVSSSSSTSRSGAAAAASGGGGGDALGPEHSLAGDASGAAMKVGEKYLRDLRTTDRGHKLLAKASVLLQTNRELLRPENFVKTGAQLNDDLDAREAFITSVKNIALEFLMSYLPTVVVPPINDTRDGVWYEITNIDLGGFQVDSEHVHVRIEEDNIIIHASHITCEMKNLLWAYRKLTFPRLSGKGTADANATDIEFALRLKLAYPKDAARQRKQHAERYGRFTEAKTRPKHEDHDDVDEPDSSPERSPAGSAASSRKSSSAILAAGTMGMTDRERSWHAAREQREAAAAAAAAAVAQRDQQASSSRPMLIAAKSVDRGAPPRTPQHLPLGAPPMTRPSSGSVGSSSIAAAPAAWTNRTPDLKARPAVASAASPTTTAEPALAVGRGPSTLSSPLLNEEEEDDTFMLPPTGEPVRAEERSTSLALPPFAAPAAAAAPGTASPTSASASTASPLAKPVIAWGDQAVANRSRASTQLDAPAPASSASSNAAAAAASSTAAAAASPSASVVSTAPASPALAASTGTSPSMGASSRSSAFLATVSTDLGQPSLVMHSCHLRLNAFAIAIHSGFLKSIYNFLLNLFSEDVKQYLEDTLNYEMGLRSVEMLRQINILAVDYIPMLQRIMVKATTAAMEDEGNEAAAAAAAAAGPAGGAGSTKSSAVSSPALGPSVATVAPAAAASKPQSSSTFLPAFQPPSAAVPGGVSAGAKRVPPSHKPPPPGTAAASPKSTPAQRDPKPSAPVAAASSAASASQPASAASPKGSASADLASFYQLPPKPVYGSHHVHHADETGTATDVSAATAAAGAGAANSNSK